MQVTKEIVSVSEMARMLGLSRARLYQLMKEGVFPSPTRPNNGGRPFFDREQQEQCFTVRRTNCGINGQAILFYAMRSTPAPPRSANRRPRRAEPSRRDRPVGQAPETRELRHGLTQLGLVDVTDQRIRTALAEAYPDGWSNVDAADLLRSVFARLNRQDSPGNVAR
jgi:DNA-binding transcriptional MerR regulator